MTCVAEGPVKGPAGPSGTELVPRSGKLRPGLPEARRAFMLAAFLPLPPLHSAPSTPAAPSAYDVVSNPLFECGPAVGGDGRGVGPAESGAPHWEPARPALCLSHPLAGNPRRKRPPLPPSARR